MRLLLGTFVLLIGITVWSLAEKEPPTLVKPIPSPSSVNNKQEKRQLVALGDSLTA